MGYSALFDRKDNIGYKFGSLYRRESLHKPIINKVISSDMLLSRIISLEAEVAKMKDELKKDESKKIIKFKS